MEFDFKMIDRISDLKSKRAFVPFSISIINEFEKRVKSYLHEIGGAKA